MKKILLLVAMVLCLGIVAAQAAESTKELSTTQRDFVREYNRAGGDLGFNFLPTINNSDVKRLEGSVKDATNVKLTEYSSIVLTFPKESKAISEAMFIGVGNNERAGALITASGICAMRAFASKEPLALAKEKIIAMFEGVLTDGKDRIETIGSVRFKLFLSESTGLTLAVTPAG